MHVEFARSDEMISSRNRLKLTCRSLCAVFFAVPLAQPSLGEDLNGQLIFNNNCRTCHSMDKGDNRLGPTLHNVIGRKAGSVEGFGFSPSLENANITWSAETLDKFIEDPDAVVPGNQMQPYGGMKDANERAALVTFLGQ